MLNMGCENGVGPMADVVNKTEAETSMMEISGSSKKSRKTRREQHMVVRDFMTALALCHNVTPTYPDAEDSSKVEFQASSPDEVALVKFADSLGMNLVARD